MPEQNFKPGDKVVLNSGGPTMTVESYKASNDDESKMVLCTWFSSGQLTREYFTEATLKAYQPQSLF